ncbi:epoxide hydrolase [Sphingobium sp. V4]|uniref:epoxide hydrolase family protein n=1 Tax=Sphingobium sp. V4 TaxID=3038927 RepID=UPI00255825F2|nr:epoxide hydrolase family protein [Sphingobium sp. V4]WIW89463.1 epoxide hydrolase [Sphingobium sp. V4]
MADRLEYSPRWRTEGYRQLMLKELQPFEVAVSDAELAELEDRIHRTRWGGDFGGDDWSFGTNGVYLRELADYWLYGYDWRKTEAAINAYPNFRMEIRDIPIHFMWIKGKGPSPKPLILTHGWPWTFWDYRKLIGPLSDPAAHGGDPRDAFDLVIPSLPGYGFSGPAANGIAFWEIADLWAELMTALGYASFGAAGSDWGAFVTAQLGHKYADRVFGVHFPLMLPLDALSGGGGVDPALYSDTEQEWLAANLRFRADGYGYALLQKTRPRTHSFSANDSPVGLLAWIVEKRRSWSDCSGEVESRFSKDDLLDTAMIYWVTQSFGTAARLYYETTNRPWIASHDRSPVVEAPVAVPVFPKEVMHMPRKWAQQYYNLKRWTSMSNGGHFAPMEQPQAMIADLRAFFADCAPPQTP